MKRLLVAVMLAVVIAGATPAQAQDPTSVEDTTVEVPLPIFCECTTWWDCILRDWIYAGFCNNVDGWFE